MQDSNGRGRGRFQRVTSVALIAAGLAAVSAAPASAAKVNGTVVARDAHRGTVVTATRGGQVATLRVKQAKRIRVGRKVRASAVRLADGTYRASRLRVGRKGGRVKIRATVVRRAGRGYLVSAGSSTFAVRSRAARRARISAASAAAAPLQPGDIVVVTGSAAGGVLQADEVTRTGQTAALEIEGIFLGSADGRLRIAVEHLGEVTVNVPDGMTVDAVAGDEVELLVSVADDGTFTLIAVDDEQQGDDHDGFDYDVEDGEVDLEGTVTALAADSVTVEAAPGASVTCAVPAGTDLSGFAVGDQVELKCELVDGAFTLRELQSETAEVKVGDASGSDDHSDHADGSGSDDHASGDAAGSPASGSGDDGPGEDD